MNFNQEFCNDAKHPKHALNNIKNIPQVKNDSTIEREKFRKNLEKASNLSRLNISAERAAAKS